MNARKINSTTKINNTNKSQTVDNNHILVVIKDGYHAGDKLLINSNDVQYSWSDDNKSLLISTAAADSTKVLDILALLQIKGVGNEDRFVDVKMITQSGEEVDLKEFSINPNSLNTNNLAYDLEQKIDYAAENNATKQPTNGSYLEYLSTNNFALDDVLEENSLNFLPQSVEEELPVLINKIATNNVDSGDVYKIIKDSFKETDRLEIWGYDFSKDQLDLQDFVTDINHAFDYYVNNGDLELNLHTPEKDYSVVLKDINNDKFSDLLEEGISHIIINSIKLS